MEIHSFLAGGKYINHILDKKKLLARNSSKLIRIGSAVLFTTVLTFQFCILLSAGIWKKWEI